MASTAMRTLIALLSTGGLPRLDFFALFIVGLSWFYDVIKQRAEQVLEYLFGPNPDHQGRNERHPGRTGPCQKTLGPPGAKRGWPRCTGLFYCEKA
jgi:hypothetical protein